VRENEPEVDFVFVHDEIVDVCMFVCMSVACSMFANLLVLVFVFGFARVRLCMSRFIQWKIHYEICDGGLVFDP
jgi:hypothetical protein